MRQFFMLFILLCGITNAAEQEWMGFTKENDYKAETKKLEPGTFFVCGENKERKLYTLSGPGLISAEKIKLRYFWHLKGTLSADEKNIVVREMKQRDEWEGEVVNGLKANNQEDLVWLRIGTRAWYLNGNLANREELKKGGVWKIKGLEEKIAEGKVHIQVKEMRRVETK